MIVRNRPLVALAGALLAAVALVQFRPDSAPARGVTHAPAASAPAQAEGPSVEQLWAMIARLQPLHKKLAPARDGQWLARYDEPGQTFEQYMTCLGDLPPRRRRILYIQPLGEFTPAQREIVALTAEFAGLYLGLPVRISEPLSLSILPASARREHPLLGVGQILTSHVLDSVLPPRLADDAATCIAVTARDLWPGDGWDFVLAQASLDHRVCVVSMHRNGDPGCGAASLRLCLLRTMKAATHEMGHVLGMRHCIAWECNMCGSSGLDESDSRPVALCPQCLAKLCWARRIDPARRYQALAEFCRKQGLVGQAEFYERSVKALEN